MKEHRFSLCNIDRFNGYSIRPPPSTCTVAFTDASSFAFADFSTCFGDSVVPVMWTSEEAAQSSTFRELKDILYVLVSYASQLQSKRVTVKTESQSAANIVSVGSSKSHLLDIFQLCLENAIVLEAQWTPRSLIDRADMLSRFIDPDDWSLHPSVFRLLDARWGPHTIDRFASHYITQLPLFNSKYASPRTCGVDAFIQDWSRWHNWLCAPPRSLPWSRHSNNSQMAFSRFLAIFAFRLTLVPAICLVFPPSTQDT